MKTMWGKSHGQTRIANERLAKMRRELKVFKKANHELNCQVAQLTYAKDWATVEKGVSERILQDRVKGLNNKIYNMQSEARRASITHQQTTFALIELGKLAEKRWDEISFLHTALARAARERETNGAL
jgi:hypothetical protein